MTKAKRFAFVKAPGRPTVHRIYGQLTDGEPTACGIRVKAGWAFWYRKEKRHLVAPCKRCEVA